MSAYEILAIVATGIGGLYVIVRLAIRAEVQELDARIAKEYVSRAMCGAHRADCARMRELEARAQQSKP